MRSNPPRDDGPAPAPLALRAKQAAAALGISARKLWSLTAENAIPHVRIGKAVLYPVNAIQAWLDEQVQKGVRR